jgi:hypothetical protein
VLVIKLVPMVERNPVKKWPETHCIIVIRIKANSDKQPIDCAHLATEARLAHSRVSDDHDIDCAHVI